MLKVRQILNRYAERLFVKALEGKWAHKTLLRVSAFLNPIPYGLWLFRKGDISHSQRVLQKSRYQPFVVKRCLERAEEILEVLKKGAEAKVVEKSPNLHSFNHKVVFACHSSGYFHANGYAVRSVQIAESLARQGVKVIALTRLGYPWDMAAFRDAEKQGTSSFASISFKHRYDPNRAIFGTVSSYVQQYAAYLKKEVQACGASVIHAHSNYLNGLAAAEAGAALGCLSVYEVRGLWHMSRAVKEPGYEDTEHYLFCEKMEVLAAANCDQVVTLNHALRQWLIGKGVAAEKITVVQNGVTPFQAENAMPGKIASVPFMLGFIGSLTAYEGLDDVIQAMAMVKKEGLRAKLVIAGKGTELARLKQLCRELEVDDRVQFEGYIERDEVPAFYQKVDAIIIARKNHPVTRWVTPIKLMEAMMYQKGLIVSDLPALTEVAIEGQNALLVEADSPAAIAQAIQKLLAEPEWAAKLGRQGYADVIEKYDWHVLGKRYLDLYTSRLPANS